MSGTYDLRRASPRDVASHTADDLTSAGETDRPKYLRKMEKLVVAPRRLFGPRAAVRVTL
jgi:hypothetical protein